MSVPAIEPAIAAVQAAAVVCRHVQRSLDALRAMTKDDASPVTIGDFASQAVVARALTQAGIMRRGLIAEESGAFLKQPEHQTHLEACLAALHESGAWPKPTADDLIAAVDLGDADPAALTSSEGGWTLDPIDGTKGFLRGEQYCISLAFIRNGAVELGILGCPNLAPTSPPRKRRTTSDFHSQAGSISYALRSQGAFELNPEHPTAPTRLSLPPLPADHPARLAESVETAHTRKDIAADIMSRASPVGPSINMDSQAKYALLARGDADVYLRLPSRKGYIERIWDHAAGMLLAQEAGCTITDIRGKPLDFSHGRGLETNAGILGAPPALHTRLLAAAREVLKEPLA